MYIVLPPSASRPFLLSCFHPCLFCPPPCPLLPLPLVIALVLASPSNPLASLPEPFALPSSTPCLYLFSLLLFLLLHSTLLSPLPSSPHFPSLPISVSAICMSTALQWQCFPHSEEAASTHCPTCAYTLPVQVLLCGFALQENLDSLKFGFTC